MAEQSGLFTSVAGDRKYPARWFCDTLHDVSGRSSGVFAGYGESLAVRMPSDYAVAVGTGVALIEGVHYRNDSEKLMTLAPISAGKKRIDLVVVHLDRAARSAQAVVVTGTAATVAVRPAISSETDVLLASVSIDASGGTALFTLSDERAFRKGFLRSDATLDDLADGSYAKLLAAKAQAINAGRPLGSRIQFARMQGFGGLDETCVRTLADTSIGMLVAGLYATGKVMTSWYGADWVEASAMPLGVPRVMRRVSSGLLAGVEGAVAHVYKASGDATAWTDMGTLAGEQGVGAIVNLEYSYGLLAGSTTTASVWKAPDSGTPWTKVQRLGTRSSIGAMLYSSASQVVLAGTDGGDVYRSTDRGASFTLAANLGAGVSEVLAFHDAGSGVMLAGVRGKGLVYRSVNAGLTWSPAQQLGNATALRCFVSDGQGGILAGTGETYSEVYRSVDGGVSWDFVQRLGTSMTVHSLFKTSRGMIVAALEGPAELYRSELVSA